VLAAGLVLCACDSTLAGASPSPQASVPSVAPSASPSTSAAAAGPLPRSAVRITVNGASYDWDKTFQLTPTGQPVVLEMAFPFAVDRPFLETWLPTKTASVTWIDDRTVGLTFPETDSNIGFKVPETRSADHRATIDMFVVNVTFPASRVVSLYTVAELTGGARVPTPALSVRVSAPGALKVSPDGRRAVAFTYAPPAPLILVDLTTRTSAPLSGPTAADGPFVFADWLRDGRLLVVGRTVWIGNADGGAMRMVADAIAALGTAPSAAVPDPKGERVALTGSVVDGHVALLDLGTGSVTRITGPFRRSPPESGASLAWSKDGALLAGSDDDASIGGTVRVRIVDPALDRTVRTIEGAAREVSALPSGELLVVRDTDRIREFLGVVMGFDGVEHTRYVGGGAWWMSPDARYLVQMEPNGGAGYPALSLIDLTSRRSTLIAGQAPFVGWLADGRLAFADGR
jgi:hypothetical protein